MDFERENFITFLSYNAVKFPKQMTSSFITEGLPFYDGSDDANDVFYVRFYEGDRYVPYVSVQYFLENCANFNMESISYADGKYKYQNKVNGKNFPLTVDIRADTLYCPELVGFINKTARLQNALRSLSRSFCSMTARHAICSFHLPMWII